MGSDDDRRAEAFLPLKPRVFEALLVLSQRPLHGYALKQELYQRTGGSIDLGPGTLYRTIRSLEADALIEEIAEPPDADDGDERRRCYRVTSLGRDVLGAEARRLEALLAEARGALRR
ncbi:MAG: PadR family transcriptional regulator [Acidobacteriota bacterium]|jgi:DNA-binding PadR family transcriptional regulator